MANRSGFTVLNFLEERAGWKTGLLFFLWPLFFSRGNAESMWLSSSGMIHSPAAEAGQTGPSGRL
jgi:hypothetical protein